ncbi:MAG: tRNA dihydrouridine synthase DusB [Erysipelotrichaceae bacterium]|nr:tRNA dihydrouridine synthase DusB [Erysipelotrichaceae bacterium]
MLKIGNVKIKKPVIVAPLAGISNDAYRSLCLEYGAGLVCGEMISDKAIYYNNAKTFDMIDYGDIHPSSLQLFGSDVKTMENAAKVVNNVNCDIIDINMGCPVNKVIKTGAGSALMKDEELAVEICKAVIKASNKPVTVKMRLGFDSKHLNYLSLAKKLEDIGVSAITLHARTRSQMYEGKANWDHIRILHNSLKIPVIGNGDIKSLDDYIAHKNDCDAIMIGRGLVGNPFLIKQINAYEQGKIYKEITYKDKIRACLKHIKKLVELKGEEVAIKEMRGIAPHYLNGLYNSSIYKTRLSRANTLKEAEKILKEYEKSLGVV